MTLALLGLIVVGYLVTTATGAETEAEKERRTADALAQAKEALIAYALARSLGAARPGDLPCPDTDGDGSASLATGGPPPPPETCSAQNARIGRLPWRTLGLPDLRDGDGERLWYAVSVNFKDAPRTTCTDPTQAGCLNSDTPGTITVYDRDGRKIHDASGAALGGVVAVIIAPGAVLRRAGSGTAQNRDPTSPAALNNPQNYLDVMPAGTLTAFAALSEDNAGFADATDDGFIQGPVRDAAGNVIVNDRILVITYQDLMPLLERRVAAEVVACLQSYAARPGANQGRYPGAASMANSSGSASYGDGPPLTRRGRIPDEPFDHAATFGLDKFWDASCTLTQPWWMNWKSHVLYAVASPFAPDAPTPVPGTCATCLTVNPPSALADKRFVVLVAKRALAGQLRTLATDRASPTNYLEGENDWDLTSADSFAVLSSPQSDLVVYR